MVDYVKKLISKLKKSEKGQGMVEYALIIAFVAAIAIFVLNGALKDSVESAFNQASQTITSATAKATAINN